MIKLEKLFSYENNIRLEYSSNILFSMMFHTPIFVIYLLNIISMTKIMFLYSWMKVVTSLMEVPSGVIADVYSRKVTVIIGCLLLSTGLFTIGFSQSFPLLLLGFSIMGLGRALKSGSHTALFYDSLKNLNREDETTGISGNIMFYSRLVRAMVSVIAGYIAMISLEMNIYLSSGMYFLGFILFFFYKEPEVEREEVEGFKKYTNQTFKSFKHLFSHKNLFFFMLFVALFKVIVQTMGKFKQPLLLNAGVNLSHLGIIYGVFMVLIALGQKYSYFFKKLDTRKIFTLLIILFSTSILIITLTNLGPIILFGFALISLIRGVEGPLKKEFLNKLIPSSRRATIQSINSIVYCILFGMISVSVGWLSDNTSTHIALIVTNVILLSSLLLIKQVNFVKPSD